MKKATFLEDIPVNGELTIPASLSDINRFRTYSYRIPDSSFSFRNNKDGTYQIQRMPRADEAAKKIAKDIILSGKNINQYDNRKFTPSKIKAVISELTLSGYVAEYRKLPDFWEIEIFKGATVCYDLILAIEKNDLDAIASAYEELGKNLGLCLNQ